MDSRESARDRILRVAAHLYAQRGYHATSMRDIAQAAGVTKPLIHYHFASKSQLFASLLQGAVDSCADETRRVQEQNGGARARLAAWNRAMVDLARRSPAVFSFLHQAITLPGTLPLGSDARAEMARFFGTLVEIVRDGQAAGELRGIDPEVVATLPLSILDVYVSAVLCGDRQTLPETLDATMTDLLLNGAGTSLS
jgi:AcrR family transcriptional regulator